ncbi:MAG: LAGLIDADG family homing endonuclease [Candidatus Yanofskybacteria bacterium]|nr:LAGLIDADG family homing endonuclease [Candidatus Yanofskybacteria bacterium]
MSRIKFGKGAQTRFLFASRACLGLRWSEFAAKLEAHPRCLSDWRREKCTLPESVFGRLLNLTGEKVQIPPHKTLPDFWSIEKAARKGGQAVAAKYGGPGTPEGRRKGGTNSQIQRKLHPDLYQHCNLRKEITRPRNSAELSEFIGIILGDGGMNSDNQVVISLHRENDRRYSKIVAKLAKKLFAIESALYNRTSIGKEKVVEVVLTGVNVIEFLTSKGLIRGNKVAHQVDVPAWIQARAKLSTHCMRGLIDTDGGVFYHRHKNGGYDSLNVGLQFSNRSKPLLRFVHHTLAELGFTPKIDSRCVNLYKEDEVFRYAEEIQFHNPYHAQRVEQFRRIKKEFSRRGA